MSGFTVEIEGFDEVIKQLQKLEDRVKRRELLKIFRRQAEPVKRVMAAQAPRANRTVSYHRDNSIKYTPGNLKRSIKKFTGRSKDYPNIQVGPQAKKAEGSGYYGYFVAYGTKRIRRKNNFIKRTDSLVSEIIGDRISGELKKYLEREAKKLGFENR
jgi:hypothetical protein